MSMDDDATSIENIKKDIKRRGSLASDVFMLSSKVSGIIYETEELMEDEDDISNELNMAVRYLENAHNILSSCFNDLMMGSKNKLPKGDEK